MIEMTPPPVPEAMIQRLKRLFEKADEPRGTLPPGFPQWETTLEEWLDVVLPDFGSTPRKMLSSDDEGTLALLDRFVNAIATSRALSHPRVVRDIVRQRIEAMFRQPRDTDSTRREPKYVAPGSVLEIDVSESFEHWMEVPNPLFGDLMPRDFFDGAAVDAERIREISSLLDSIDDGAFS